MDERFGKRRLAERSGIGGGHLDEVAEHVVMAHLQRLDAGRLGIGRLQSGDDLARAVAELALLVEIGARAVTDEASVARIDRQALGERSSQRLLDAEGSGLETLRNCA